MNTTGVLKQPLPRQAGEKSRGFGLATLWEIFLQARQTRDAYNRLNRLSDAQLARRGLERGDLLRTAAVSTGLLEI